MSERSARSNSVGGLKSAKKESRPVMEKTFQLAAQQKVRLDFYIHNIINSVLTKKSFSNVSCNLTYRPQFTDTRIFLNEST